MTLCIPNIAQPGLNSLPPEDEVGVFSTDTEPTERASASCQVYKTHWQDEQDKGHDKAADWPNILSTLELGTHQ